MTFFTNDLLNYSIDQATDLIIWIGDDGRLLHANQAALDFYGYALDEFTALTIHHLDSDFSVDQWDQHWEALKRNGHLTVLVQHRNCAGLYCPVEIADTYQNYQGREFSVAVIRNIGHRVDRTQRMQLMQFSVDQMRDSALWIDGSANIVFANDAACRNLGYAEDELLQMTIHQIDPNFPSSRWPDHWAELRQAGSLTFETLHRTKQGRDVSVEVNANLVQGFEQEYNCAFVRDITQRKEQEARLAFLSSHDQLTGLPNRDLLIRHIQQAVIEAEKLQQTVLLLQIDLDNFNQLNYRYGRNTADQLLRTVAQRITSLLGESAMVGRLDRAGFIVLLQGLPQATADSSVIDQLLPGVEQAMMLDDQCVELRISIGAALYPLHADTAERLVRCTDIAQYHARGGDERRLFYQPGMDPDGS